MDGFESNQNGFNYNGILLYVKKCNNLFLEKVLFKLRTKYPKINKTIMQKSNYLKEN